EDCAADVLDRSVHVPGWCRGVLEDAELPNLAGDVVRVRRQVSLFDADEDEKAVVDGAGGPAVDLDRGRRHALDDVPHTTVVFTVRLKADTTYRPGVVCRSVRL